jgi:hypothetical protein
LSPISPPAMTTVPTVPTTTTWRFQQSTLRSNAKITDLGMRKNNTDSGDDLPIGDISE